MLSIFHRKENIASTGFLNLVSPVQFGPGVYFLMQKNGIGGLKIHKMPFFPYHIRIIFLSFGRMLWLGH